MLTSLRRQDTIKQAVPSKLVHMIVALQLQPNFDSLVQIASVIILAVVSIAAALIAARYTEKYRDQSENKAEHYKQIKVGVLDPMLRQTDEHYLPILEFKKASLEWSRRDLRRFAVGLDEEPLTYEVIANIVPSSALKQRLPMIEGDEAKIETELYDDCKTNHFKMLFEKWESLISRVNELNRQSLELANTITQSIADKLGLPIIGDWDRPGQYVTPYCGVAIFNRMAGTGMYQLSSGVQDSGHGKHQNIAFGNPIVQVDPSADVQKIRNMIDEEINGRREKFLILKATADSIDKEFAAFRTQLAKMMEKQKLSGKCDYT